MIPVFITVLFVALLPWTKCLLSSLLPLQRRHVQFDLHEFTFNSLSRLILALRWLLKHKISISKLIYRLFQLCVYCLCQYCSSRIRTFCLASQGCLHLALSEIMMLISRFWMLDGWKTAIHCNPYLYTETKLLAHAN